MKLFDNSIKTNWKFIAIIVLIATVVSVGGILVLKATQPRPVAQTPPPASSPQPQILDTSTWQTYRNDEFGFEVRYL